MSNNNNPGYSLNSPFTMNFPDKNTGALLTSNDTTENLNNGSQAQITTPTNNDGYPTNFPFTENIPQNQQNKQQIPIYQQSTSQPLNNPNTVIGTNGTVFTWKNNPDLSPRNTGTQNNVVNNNTPVNYNIGLGREQDIINNIADGIKNDARVKQAVESGDFETFKKIYGYDTADDTKKNILTNQFQASFLMDENSLFAGLIAGRKYANEVIMKPEYKNAQERANKYLKYGSASINELTAYINSGELLQGTQAYDDLLRNPIVAEKLRQAKTFALSRGNLNFEAIGEKTKKEIMEKSPNTMKMLDDGYISVEEYEKEIMTPSLRAKMEEVQEKKNKYDTLKREWDNIEEDVNKDSRYSGLSATGKRALIEDRRKGMRFTLGIAMDELNNATGMLTEMQKTQASILEMNYSLYKDSLAFDRQKELSMFQSNLDLEQKSRLFDLEQSKIHEAMNDPYQAIPKMLDEFAQIGVNTQRSTQEIIDEANIWIKNGKSLGEYMTHLRGLMQSKPEYKAIMSGQMEKWNPTEYKEIGGQLYKIKNGQLYNTGIPTEKEQYQHINLGDGNMGVFNPQTGEVQMISANQGVGDLSRKRLTAENGVYVGVECGQFAREAAGMSTLPGGNNLSARKKEFKEKNPKVGGMVLFVGGVYDTTYGHIALVESTNPDGSINIVESNLKNDKRVTRRTINSSDSTIYGYYNNTPLAKKIYEESTNQKGWIGKTKDMIIGGINKFGRSENKEEINEEMKIAKTLYKNIQSGTMTFDEASKRYGTDKQKPILNALNQLIADSGGYIPALESSEQVRNMDEIISRLNQTLEDENYERVSGMSYGSLWDKTFGYARDNTLANLAFVLDSGTLQKLIDAKANGATFGALSNDELKMLQNSSSILSKMAVRDEKGNIKGFKTSEENMRSEIEKLRNIFVEKRAKMVQKGKMYNNISTPSKLSLQEQENAIINAFSGK